MNRSDVINNKKPAVRAGFFVLIAYMLAATLTACEKPIERVSEVLSGETMGTYYRVVLVDSAALTASQVTKLEAKIKATLDAVNQSMSTYIDSSEISQLNDSRSEGKIEISDELRVVLEASLKIARQSDGAFDITTQPLIEAWGFDAKNAQINTLSDSDLANIRSRIGFDKFELDADGLTKTQPELEINLSAIAKGYAVDQIANLLKRNDWTDFLVDIGGELKARGKNKLGQDWKIGIEQPSQAKLGEVQALVKISEASVATSGDYRNYIEIFDQRFSHVFDPRLGRPVNHKLASVTVIHESAMMADGWATALMVMGEEKGFEFAQNRGLKALFLSRSAVNLQENGVKSAQDQHQIRYTRSFEPYLVVNN